MVKLHIKKGDDSQFLCETTVDILVDELLANIVAVYNGRLKVQRICAGLLLILMSWMSSAWPVFVTTVPSANVQKCRCWLLNLEIPETLLIFVEQLVNFITSKQQRTD